MLIEAGAGEGLKAGYYDFDGCLEEDVQYVGDYVRPEPETSKPCRP